MYTKPRTYRKITGKQAYRIWQAVYKNMAYTDHGCRWAWAEILTDTRNVFFHPVSGCLLTCKKVEILIGL